jgi:hypothetical protein
VTVLDASTGPAPSTPRAGAAWSTVAWRAPLGALVGLLTAVPVLLVSMNVLRPLVVQDPASSPYAVLAAGLARLLVLSGSVVVGLLLAVAVVLVLLAQRRTGRPSLRRASLRAARRLPVLLGAVAVQGLLVLLALVGALLLVLAAAVRVAVWEQRRRTASDPKRAAEAAAARRAAALDLVPFAVLARALTQLAFVLPVALLGPGSLRGVLRGVRTAARGRVLAALRAMGLPLLVNAVLTLVAMPRIEAAAAEQPVGEAYGPTAALLGVTVLSLLVLAAGLARLTHRADVDLSPSAPRGPRVPAQRTARSPLRRRPARTAAAALISCIALVSTNLDPAPVLAAVPGDIVVDTLTDSLTPDPLECQGGAACSLRGALALAAAQAAPPLTIGFSVSGTVSTLDTLLVPHGVTIDGHDGIVLDGGLSHRVLRVDAGDSASVGLSHLRVTRGRSDAAGAGLHAGPADVTLDHVQFSDNVSGTDGATGIDGGAVAASYSKVVVRSSTFDHNVALAGRGGAVSALRLDWTNSTSYADKGVAGEAIGGAVHVRFGGTVLHGTFVAGGGVAGDENTPVSVVNSVSDPDGTIGAFPCQYVTGSADAVPSVGNVDPSGMCGSGLQARPGPLGPLTDNGGPTDTVALLSGSPALSAADPAACAAVDQRGRARSPSSCDAGAFQLGTGDVRPVVTLDRVEGGDSLDVVAAVRVEVPAGSSPAGAVTLLDGSSQLGDPVTVVVSDGSTTGSARLPGRLSPGRHLLSVRFDPDSTAVAAATSVPIEYVARTDATVVVTAPVPARVGAPTTLTVTARPSSGSALVPTGEVVLTSGPDEEVLSLVDGSATWSVPILRRGTVTAAYRGDDAYRAATTSSVVTSSDVPSTTTLVLADSTPERGTSVPVSVQVSGGGTGAYGRVLLEVDGAPLDGGAVVAGAATLALDTSGLSVGSHTAVLTFTAEAGWRDSSSRITFEVLPASLAVGLTVSSDSIRWGDLATAAVTVSSPHDGPIALELLGGDEVLATQSAVLENGTAAATFDLVRIVRPLTGELRVRASGDGSFATGTSEPARFTVAAAPTTISLTTPSFAQFPPQVGQPMTLRLYLLPLTATVVRVEGTVEVFLDGVSAGQFPVTQQGFDVTVTPTVGGTVTTRVVFTDTGASPALLGSSTEKLLQIAAGPSKGPVLAWAGDLRPGATRLDVTFPGAGTLSAPTGVVTIVDGLGLPHGSATLMSGRASVPFDGHAITYAGSLRLRYSGDASHAAADFFPPPVTIAQHESVTTLAGVPPVLTRNARVVLSATVSGVPAGTRGRVVLMDGPDEVTSAEVTAYVPVELSFSSWQLRVHTLTARFVPENALDVRGSVSAESLVDVVDHPVPRVTLTLPVPATAGEPFTVDVAARGDQPGLAAGSSVSLVRTDDPLGRGLAGATLVDGPLGLTARISVPPQSAGELSLTAVFGYGDYFQQGRSAPLVLQVAQARPTLRLSTATAPVVGDLVQVLVEADSAPALRDGARVLVAQVVVGTEPPRQVFLGPSDDVTRPIWSGSFLYWTARGGDLRVTASTDGDGGSAGPADAEATFVVARRATRISLRDESQQSTGRAPKAIAVTLTPVGGAFLVQPDRDAVLVSGEGDTAPCVTRRGVCTLPEHAVPAGTSQVRASFPGNRDFAPSTATLEVQAGPRSTEMQAHFDPPVHTWRSGQEVTATWTVETSGAPARGEAVFTLGDHVCRGPALAGSCTTTVPPWSGNGPTPELQIVQEFRPLDDAPPVKRISTTVPRTCVRVDVVSGHVRPDTGTTCTVDGAAGYLTGSRVTVVADLRPRFHAESWTLNGVAVTAGVQRSAQLDTRTPQPAKEESLTFDVLENADVAFTSRYAPACVRLTTLPEVGRPLPVEVVGGSTVVTTAPRCASPDGPTADELAQARQGSHWFLQGTRVELRADAHNSAARDVRTIVDKPAFTTESWVNAVADPRNVRFATVEVDEDTNVTAVFKVAHCVPTRVLPSDGGTVSIRYSSRPDSSYALRPITGACTTDDGRSGYVPGTTLVVDAVPTNDGSRLPAPDRSQYFFEDVSLAREAPRATPHGQRSEPDSYRPQTKKLQVLPAGLPGEVTLSGRFGHVACVPVTTRLELPESADAPRVTYEQAPNCPAKPTTSSTDRVAGSEFVTRVQTAHYVEGSSTSVSIGATRAVVKYPMFTRRVTDFRRAPAAAPEVDCSEKNVSLSRLGEQCSTADRPASSTAPPPVDQAAYVKAQGDSTANEDVLRPVWAIAQSGQPLEETTGPGQHLDLVEGADPVVMGRWFSTMCRSLALHAPDGGTVTQSPVTPQCRKGSYPVYLSTLRLEVDGGPESPQLVPWVSVPGDERGQDALYETGTQIGNDGRRYPLRPGRVVELNTYDRPDLQLEFCARLRYSVKVKHADGVVKDAPELKSVIQTDGGCPQGWSRPDRTVSMGLTEQADYAFELLGPELHRPGTVRVDAQGSTSQHHTYLLRAYCHSLSVGRRVAVQTAPDCPGAGAGHYLRGQLVELRMDLKVGETFRGWSGVDSSDGMTAFVAMTSDRVTGSDVKFPSDLEKAGAVISSVVQRTVGLAVTIGTGFLMAKAAVLGMATMAMKATAWIAEKAGAPSGFVDGVVKARNFLDAQVRIINALALCTSQWGAGGGGTLVPGDGAAGTAAAAGKAAVAKGVGSALGATFSSGEQGAVAAALNPVSLANAYGSQAANYLRDPREAWSSIGSIGSCMKDEISAAVDASSKAVGTG